MHREAEELGVDPQLLAYSRQKQDKIEDAEAMRQRTQDQKELALAQQEKML